MPTQTPLEPKNISQIKSSKSLFSNEIDLIDNIKDKLDFYLDKGGKDCKYG